MQIKPIGEPQMTRFFTINMANQQTTGHKPGELAMHRVKFSVDIQ